MYPQNPQQRFQQQVQQQQHDNWHRMQQFKWAKDQENLRLRQQQQVEEAELRNRFRRVEGDAAWLRSEFEKRRLSEVDLKVRLRNLMVQDGSGVWWMVHSRTGQWFRSDDGSWSQDDPYRYLPIHSTGTRSVPAPHRVRAVVILVVSLAVTFALGFFAANVVYEATRGHPLAPPVASTLATIVACTVWILGLIRSLISARRRWREG